MWGGGGPSPSSNDYLSLDLIFYEGPIYWNILSPQGGGNISQCNLGKNMKRQREIGGKCKRKRKKGERKRKKGERK
jgi:hypothetical protein